MLDDAGLKDRSITISAPQGSVPLVSELTQIIAANLQAVGFTVKTQIDEQSQFSAKIYDFKNNQRDLGDLFIYSFQGGPGSETTMRALTYSTGNWNWSHYDNPKVDSLFDDARDSFDAAKRGTIGAMLQTGAVLRDLSVRELVDMMASLYPAPLGIEETMRLANVTDIADRKTQRLSGGQTQRVRFAVAMVSNPDLLVLDEPTVALDVEARREFWATMREFAARGKTVVFATHYLEEADAYSDRIILMARGVVVADGPATEIKATVGLRTIRATLPGADLDALRLLPGVTNADTRGEAVVLNCSDADTALRAFLPAYPQAHDIEVSGAGLEEAFVQLTADVEEPVR